MPYIVAQAGHELTILLSQLPKCWDGRWAPSYPASLHYILKPFANVKIVFLISVINEKNFDRFVHELEKE
jgi:hypothetical protein